MSDEDVKPPLSLMPMLRFAYSMWLTEHRSKPLEVLQQRAEECGAVVASNGDALLFGGKRPLGRKACSEAFNRLAEGLACMTLCGHADDVEGILFALTQPSN